MVQQKQITLPSFQRGYHLITNIIEKELPELPEKGIANFTIKHTSAALTINENADPAVRNDFKTFMRKLVPENVDYYTHTLEGQDDITAHIKASLIGQSVTVPITNHKLNLGTWQGIYLCEFRNHGGQRKIVITVMGE